MLQVDLRELRQGPLDTAGQLEPGLPALADVALAGPLQVRGTLQVAGEGEYYWRAELRGAVAMECRRCLRPVTRSVDTELRLLFSADPDRLDDPSVYPIPDAHRLDLLEAVREELLLAIPGFTLCREDCAGLCPKCGDDLNAGPCRCGGSTEL